VIILLPVNMLMRQLSLVSPRPRSRAFMMGARLPPPISFLDTNQGPSGKRLDARIARVARERGYVGCIIGSPLRISSPQHSVITQ